MNNFFLKKIERYSKPIIFKNWNSKSQSTLKWKPFKTAKTLYLIHRRNLSTDAVCGRILEIPMNYRICQHVRSETNGREHGTQQSEGKLSAFSHDKIKSLKITRLKKKTDSVVMEENDGRRRGSWQRQEVRKPVRAHRVLFCHFNKLYTWRWCSGWFYTLVSWSYLMFYCIWQSYFFSDFKPLKIRLR